MDFLQDFNRVIGLLLMLFFSYQAVYVLVALLPKKRTHKKAPLRTYAVMIAARNESAVIGHLIDSIRRQTYPDSLYKIFVVADNCTDDTAEIARAAGAVVYERNNPQEVGKGYALQYLLDRIWNNFGKFDGYMVFDADNILDPNYIAEMNKTLSRDNQAATGYRNSKNYGTNWLTAGISLWFLRESQFLNRARGRLRTSCAVSGTGFAVLHDLLERYGGWKWFLLTEDIEFSSRCIIDGVNIGYCETAVLYDEQPVTLAQSCRQRMRWSKGLLQVLQKNGPALLCGVPRSFACFDILATTAPFFILGTLSLLINGGILLMGITVRELPFGDLLEMNLIPLLKAYGALFAAGLITTLSEWQKIQTGTGKKLLYLFTFPLFCATFLPVSLAALFTKVTWKPIHHTAARSLDEILTVES